MILTLPVSGHSSVYVHGNKGACHLLVDTFISADKCKDSLVLTIRKREKNIPLRSDMFCIQP